MRIALLFVLCFVSSSVLPQKPDWNRVDQQVNQIPASAEKSIPALALWIKISFTTQPDRIRAIQRWIALNLKYDFTTPLSVITQKENPEIIAAAFKTRKAVCGGYAGLMDSVCKLMNIKSFVIDGYTIQDEKINPNAHAWVAALIDEKWYLFDPTWSSGSLVNGQYEHEFDESYFMVKPEKMIETHIPFDPIWQFQDFPVMSRNNGNAQQKTFYDFEDSIQDYFQLPDKQKITKEIDRINQTQTRNQAIVRRLSFLYSNLDVEIYNENVNLYNEAIKLYNDAVNKWDDYIGFRNKHLDDIQAIKKKSPKLDEVLQVLEKANHKLKQMKELPSDMSTGVFELRDAIRTMQSQVQGEKKLMKTK